MLNPHLWKAQAEEREGSEWMRLPATARDGLCDTRLGAGGVLWRVSWEFFSASSALLPQGAPLASAGSDDGMDEMNLDKHAFVQPAEDETKNKSLSDVSR